MNKKLIFGIIVIGLFSIVFLISNEQLAYGQYRSCDKPDERTLNYQNTTFTITFEGNECQFPMVLRILQEENQKTIDLNETVSGNVSLELEIIQENLYLVWNDLKPIDYDKSDWVDPAGTIVIPSSFLTKITLKKISLDGNTIGKNRELDVSNYYNPRPVDIVEINDTIWLFWQATDSRTDKQNLIKTKIVDEFFIDHQVLIKDSYFIEIKKIVNQKESDLHLIFLRMDGTCEESPQKDNCSTKDSVFMLGTGKQINPGFVYGMIPPPAQLIKIGVSPKDIICNTDLQLYYKDGNIPLCVKPYTGLYLYERGWKITNDIEPKSDVTPIWYFVPGCKYEILVESNLLCISTKDCGSGYLSTNAKGGNYMETSKGWLVTEGLLEIDYSNCDNYAPTTP